MLFEQLPADNQIWHIFYYGVERSLGVQILLNFWKHQFIEICIHSARRTFHNIYSRLLEQKTPFFIENVQKD